MLYLAALGLGVGTLVDDNVGAGGVQGVGYLAFIAPGILAVTAMQQGFEESSWPVLGALRWWGSYPAQQVTSLRTRDLLTGHLLYITVKLTVAITVFTVDRGLVRRVRLGLGAGRDAGRGAVRAGPRGPDRGVRGHPALEISIAAFYRFVILPTSLFSGAFFPVSQLPVVVEQLAYVIPLWHGVDLCRDLSLGDATLLASTGHVAYLLLWAVAGYVLATRMYARRLEP